MAEKKRTASETLDAIRRMGDEDELDDIKAMPDEEVSAAIAREGGDPEGIGERGAALAARLLERRQRLAWQAEAAERLAQARELARTAPRTPKGLPRAELLARLATARSDPRFAAPVAAAFRNRSLEESTDEELAALLDEIEILKRTAGGDGS